MPRRPSRGNTTCPPSSYAAKEETIAKVFAEGGEELDFAKVTSLQGDTASKVAKVREMNKELGDLAKEVEGLAELEGMKGRALSLGIELAGRAPPPDGDGKLHGNVQIAAPAKFWSTSKYLIIVES